MNSISKKALKKTACSADGLAVVSNGIAKVNTFFESANFFQSFFSKKIVFKELCRPRFSNGDAKVVFKF